MANGDRPVSAVLHDIVGNVQDIVRSELRLAKTEVRGELSKAGSAAVLIVVGGLLLTFGVLFVLLAIIYALSLVVAAWIAALIVGVVVGVIGAPCIAAGIRRIKGTRAVPKTTASLKENVEWAKQLTR
ncbi:MAG TPA: phage holin family protein [Steroidobacteraceae bacterium]|nr:phage holin family protein [Steroidobacteraceae bacterium]